MARLEGMKIAMLLARLHDEREFWFPVVRLREAGAKVIFAAEEAGRKYKGKAGLIAKSDKNFAQLKAADLDGVVIPGGQAPNFLRRSKECLRLVRDMHEREKMIAFICHAGWLLVTCGVLGGRRCTSVRTIRDEMVDAGARWEDSALVRDGHFISSRDPDDLPEFVRGIVSYLGERKPSAVHTAQAVGV